MVVFVREQDFEVGNLFRDGRVQLNTVSTRGFQAILKFCNFHPAESLDV